MSTNATQHADRLVVYAKYKIGKQLSRLCIMSTVQAMIALELMANGDLRTYLNGLDLE